MPLIPLQIPPGMLRNGTPFQASGRWRDGSLVRWRDGIMRPVKGWQMRTSVPNDPLIPRGAISWRDNGGDPNLAFGMPDALWHMTGTNVLTDITPVNLSGGRTSAQANTGYGGGYFGVDNFGDIRKEVVTTLPTTTWSLTNWGEDLIACSSFDRKIFQWDASVGGVATQLTNAPINNNAVVVTPERFLFALGGGGNPRRVQWCDQEDNTVWTPTATNQAGSIDLATPGSLMCGIPTRGETLLLTDFDAHTARYVGAPFVYGFEKVGQSCGLLAPLAAVGVGKGVYWMGAKGFYHYSGGAVQSLPCDVRDYVFGDLNQQQQSKTFAVANAQVDEVWWFYPSEASNEVDRYVAYNYEENHWMTGSMSRTAGVDRGAFTTPIWISPEAAIYSHETGFTHGTQKPFVVSGPVSLDAGDMVMSAVSLIPDEVTKGQVTMSFVTKFHPNNTPRTYGPYTMGTPTPVRFTGRQIEVRVDGMAHTDWRVGIPRLDIRAGGKR